MKTKFLFATLIFGAFFTSCSKDDSSPTPAASGGGGGTPTPTTTYLIAQDSTYDNSNINNTQVRLFEFNSSKKLVRVQYKWGTSTTFNQWDTVYYNVSGKVSKVEKYNTGNSSAQVTNIYNYTGSDLTSVNESGIQYVDSSGTYVPHAFARIRSFTYSGGKVISQSIVYTVGSGSSNGGPENINSMVYTNNNLSSANIQMDMGSGLQWYPITITNSSTAPNPYYGLNYDSADFINLFNQNNITQVSITGPPAITLFVDTYTYLNGRVATIVDTDLTSTPNRIRTTYITYQAL